MGPTLGERLAALSTAVVATALAGVWLAGAGDQGLGTGDFFDTATEQRTARQAG